MAGDNFEWSIALGDEDSYLLTFTDKDEKAVDMTTKAEVQVEVKITEADPSAAVTLSSLNPGELDVVAGSNGSQFVAVFQDDDIVTGNNFEVRKRFPVYVSSRTTASNWTTHMAGTLEVTQGRSPPTI